MTIGLAISTMFEAIVIADSRLSTVDRRGRIFTVRDVCQKLARPNGWSLLAFSGQLCMGRFIANGIVGRLNRTDPHQIEWLTNDDVLRDFIQAGVEEHLRPNADHRPCQLANVQVLIVFMNYVRSIISGKAAGEAGWHPGIEMVVVDLPTLTIRRTMGLGIEIIGSGARLNERLDPDLRMKLITFGGGGSRSSAVHRCFFTAIVCRTELAQLGEDTVGGLYQMAHLSIRGSEFVPYFYWAPITAQYGTYVAMRFDEGHWVQEHRPTATRTPVMNPSEIELRGPKWSPGHHQFFDPAKTLRWNSPGVIKSDPLWPVYVEYEVSPLPEQVRRSWGDEPPSVQSWRDPVPSHINPRRARRLRRRSQR